LINVWNSVLRAEITATRPFIRTSEFLWQEGHTVHETKEDADKEVMMILEFYRQLIEDQSAVPVLLGYKSEREKFVGALYTTTLEAMMPDGKALQMGTSHNLGQNFSKPFEIKYLGRDETTHYAWTTSWGVSWRIISAMIMLHGDDKGLIIPPRIAPIQVVIVPIYYREGNSRAISDRAIQVADQLKKTGFTVHVDSREQYTPGWKFNEWELKGVPLRLEIGLKDLEKHQATMVRRDNSQKTMVTDDRIVAEVTRILEDIQKNLLAKAKNAMDSSISNAKEYDEFKRILDERGGFIRSCWCGVTECEDGIRTESGATIRTIPLQPESTFSGCVRCGKPATKVVYFARAY
jgi:prolyl-tRNA synthetase